MTEHLIAILDTTGINMKYYWTTASAVTQIKVVSITTRIFAVQFLKQM